MLVCEARCNECLFSKDRIVSESRMRSILRECAKRDSHFICHKHDPADVVCRGFYDSRTTNLIRVAQRLGVVRFVPLPADGIRVVEVAPSGAEEAKR